ncbi:MAG: PEP-CTERM sorting domain-containing protein [Terriglobia bacterium]
MQSIRWFKTVPLTAMAAAFVLAVLVLGIGAAPAYSQFSCTATAGNAIWNISGSGNWDVAGNWLPSTGVPDSKTTSVCILNSGATTVTLNTFQLANMDNLTVNSADTISVSGLEVGLNVHGTSIANAGNIDFAGGDDLSSGLAIFNSATLSGGGTLTLSTAAGGGDAYIFAAAHTTPTLTNVDNTLQGNGVIGAGGGTGALALVNDLGGTIDATTASGQIATLTLNPPGGVTNQGLMEATSGTLQIQTAVANGGGKITANGGTVELLSGSSVTGGTLTNKGGTLETATANATVLDGSTTAGAVTINGTYTSSLDTVTDLNGTIINKGVIQVNGGSGNYSILGLGSPGATVENVTLQGGGTVTLSSTAAGGRYAVIEQVGDGPATLTNVNNTIQGNGAIGGNITVTNESGGMIDATTSSGQLSTLTLGGSGFTNAGLMEATNGGELLIETPVNNTGGNVTANGGAIVVDNTITGGTLNTLNGGTMETLPGVNNGANLIGVAVSAGSAYATANDNVTGLQGTISNHGTILVNGGGVLGIGSSTAPNVTLQGGGTVTLKTLSGGFEAGIAGAFHVSGATLTNVNNTIQGNGSIEGLALVNQSSGVIDATTASGLSNTLTLSGGSPITNQGLIEATSGVLVIDGGTTNNAGGNITANGGTVQLVGAIIQGGTLNTANGGTIETTTDLDSATLDGSTASGAVTINGAYTVSTDTSTSIKGTITNHGVIQVGASGSNAALLISANTTLNDGGAVNLSTSTTGGVAVLEQSGGSFTLTNVDNTVKGNGIIGNNGLSLLNDSGGTIEATTASGQITTLTINGGGKVTNNGTFEATAGTTLHATNVTFTNFSGSTLTGGTYNANGTIQINSLGFAGGEIVTNNANIILDGSNSGASAILDLAGKNALSALVANEGNFTVENGGNADFTTAGNLSNSGTVDVAASTTLTTGTGGARNYTQSGGMTTVNGTLKSSAVAINGGLLNGTGTVAGAVSIGSGGTIEAGDAPGTININGSLAIGGTLNEVITSSGFDALNITGTPGSLTLGSGSTLDILLASGYDPAAGTSFTIANFTGGLTGTFGSIANDTFNSGTEEWNVAYNSGDIVLTAGKVSTPPTTVDANWTTGSPASWTTASNWACSPGASTCVPSNGTPTNTVYDVNIDNTASGATMVLSTAETVDTLALTAGTLDIASGGSLNLANQTNGITDIPNGTGLSIAGSFTAGSNNGLAKLTSVEGALTLDNGQTTGVTPSGGTLTVSNTGSVNVSTASTVLAVTGNLSNSGAVAAAGGGAITTTGNYSQTSGKTTINGGSLGVGGGLTNSSGSNLYVQNGGSVSASSVDNSGAIITGNATSDSGNNALTVTGAFTNNTNGSLQLEANKDNATVGSFSNAGSVSLATGTKLTVNTGDSYTQSAGTTDVNGTLMSPTVNINGGTLSGNGAVQGNVTVGSGGTLLPGGTGTPGTLAVNGNLSFTGGTLDETINSGADNGYSVLNVTGALDLAGGADLDILLADDFTPTAGEQFLFATAGSLSGQFTITDPIFDSGQFEWTLSTTGDAVDIFLTVERTTAPPPTVPEPASLFLFGTGLLGLAWLARRKMCVAATQG